MKEYIDQHPKDFDGLAVGVEGKCLECGTITQLRGPSTETFHEYGRDHLCENCGWWVNPLEKAGSSGVESQIK